MLIISTLEAIELQLSRAKCPEDVFGKDPNGYKQVYQRLSVCCYPDHAQDDKTRTWATKLTQSIGDWKQLADAKTEAGTYGDMRPPKPEKPPYEETVIKIGSTSLTLFEHLEEGLVSSLHRARLSGDKTGSSPGTGRSSGRCGRGSCVSSRGFGSRGLRGEGRFAGPTQSYGNLDRETRSSHSNSVLGGMFIWMAGHPNQNTNSPDHGEREDGRR